MEKNTLFYCAKKIAGMLFVFNIAIISGAYADNPVFPVDSPMKILEKPDPQVLNVWDRYVRQFRRDHNLSFSLGYAKTIWDIKKFGDLGKKKYNSVQQYFVADYTFHILISGKSGYFLGTDSGYIYTRPKAIDDEFRASTSWLLPGVRSGLVYNYDSSGRIFVGGGAQLERFNDLRTHRSTGAWDSVAMTGESFQLFGGIDLFFSLNSAVHVAWSETRTFIQSPKESDGYLVNSTMTKRASGGELGVLYHFL